MVKRAISSYYDLLDQRIKEGTFIILIISVLIFSVWLLSTDMTGYKGNILEAQNITSLPENSIITIDGKQYKVVLEEIE